ncbi:uncharacterized protein [Dermacentor albipictus]|uniref:uncharacterized protein isoform X2 n=1 Tax=Dermacentor albipictus TaxID=60249 RepID=UPI0038FCC0DA
MAHQQLPDFDDERDNWKAYVIKAEAYFEATGVKESAKKRALLVAALSTRTVQILAGRVAPKKPNSLEYEDVVKVLDEFFDPKRHEITERFRFFNRCQLDGREFILVTDHQPLLGLLRPDRPTPPLAAARIQRWALYLGGFRYKLQYSPGKQLLNSDALSRLPQETLEPTTEGEPPDYVLALACVQEGPVSVEELQALTAGDAVL